MSKYKKPMTIIALTLAVILLCMALFHIWFQATLKSRATREYSRIAIPSDLELQSKSWKIEENSKAAGQKYWQYVYTTTLSAGEVTAKMADALRDAGYTIDLERPAECTAAALDNTRSLPGNCPFPNSYPVPIIGAHKTRYSINASIENPNASGVSQVVVYERTVNSVLEKFGE